MSAFEALTSDDFTGHLPEVLLNYGQGTGLTASSTTTGSRPPPITAVQVDGAFTEEIEGLLRLKNSRRLEMGWHLLHPDVGATALSDAELVASILLRLVSAPEYRTRLLGLKDESALSMLEIMQSVGVSFTLLGWSLALLTLDYQWLDSTPPSHPTRRTILHIMVKLSATSGQLPSSLFLEGILVDTTNDSGYKRTGGFADVYQGTYQGQPVAIKQPRFFGDIGVAHSVYGYSDLALSFLTNLCGAEALSRDSSMASAQAPLPAPFHRNGQRRYDIFNAWALFGVSLDEAWYPE
jgi:hypothetical protein